MTGAARRRRRPRPDPDRLLLLGDDGHPYQLDPARAAPVPAAADDGWVVDPDPPAPDELLG
jgi:hypothetical protein